MTGGYPPPHPPPNGAPYMRMESAKPGELKKENPASAFKSYSSLQQQPSNPQKDEENPEGGNGGQREEVMKRDSADAADYKGGANRILSDFFAKRDDYGYASRSGSGDLYGGLGGMVLGGPPPGHMMYGGIPPNSRGQPSYPMYMAPPPGYMMPMYPPG